MARIFPDAKIVSGNYAVLATDALLLVDVTAGPARLTLPAGAKGDGFIVKHYRGDLDANNITVVGKAGVSIDNAEQVSLYNSHHCVWLVFAGDRYVVLSWQ